ncbi:MAG: hypothetical protein CM15mP49_18350 [Actinomycetota bacterium]|nr:MAG: hypothetical protein CM15mP49_18350 [Actinomycetota bacterium]
MSSLRDAVIELDADVGLAFDGDADRVLAIDHEGNTIDGDHLMAILLATSSIEKLKTTQS